MKPLIPVILGTAREGRQSEHVARYIYETLSGRDDVEAIFIDVKEHTHGRTIPPFEGNTLTQVWCELVEKAQGFIIVSPEYNHGYPGELKLLLDQDLAHYAGKPVGLCGVSAGPLGGARVVEQLVQVARELGLISLSYSLYFPAVQDIFKQERSKIDEQYKNRILKLMDQMKEFLEKRVMERAT